MKKIGIINAPIASVVAELGHMDSITIGDAGLPIPGDVLRIDLALKKDVPGFIETLMVLLSEMEVEKIILAEEIKELNPGILYEIDTILSNKEVEYVPHAKFKKLTMKSKAIIRTGEFSPYANIILISGVVF